jgi:hypothetical protein
MLVAIYHIISDNRKYKELGEDWFQRRSAESKSKVLVKHLERLGYTVQLRQAQP